MKNKISVLLLTLGTLLIAFYFPAQAQQPPKKVWVIGILRTDSPSIFAARNEVFRQGLRDLGYVEGKNIIIEYRYAEGKLDRLPDLAAELVRLRVDVIVTAAASGTHAAKQATSTIPIVVASVGNPKSDRRESFDDRSQQITE